MSSQQQQQAVMFYLMFYSPCKLNFPLILELALEHSPGCIFDETRKKMYYRCD